MEIRKDKNKELEEIMNRLSVQEKRSMMRPSTAC
jgi:hypothetical protein